MSNFSLKRLNFPTLKFQSFQSIEHIYSSILPRKGINNSPRISWVCLVALPSPPKPSKLPRPLCSQFCEICTIGGRQNPISSSIPISHDSRRAGGVGVEQCMGVVFLSYCLYSLIINSELLLSSYSFLLWKGFFLKHLRCP